MKAHWQTAAVLAIFSLSPAPQAADIGERTAIVCVSNDSRSLVSLPPARDRSRPDQVVSSFTQWFFEADDASRPRQIRFLWVPPSMSSPPELKISTTDSSHGLIRLLSQTHHGLLAATSASKGNTNVGWLFAINFKAEQVISTSVYSNLGGGRGQAFSYDCRFDTDTPEAGVPAGGGDTG